MTCSATDSCTSSREPAQQTWPWLKKMPWTIPSTAWSSAASSKTMLADLPPSSSVNPMSLPASAAWMSRPTAVEPVNATLSMPSAAHQRGTCRAVAGQDVHDARRQLGLLADLGEQQRRQRRRVGRLEHRRVAGRQRRRQLPRRHQQREVPRDDLANDAARHDRTVARQGIGQLVRPARVVEEVRRRQRDVDVARLLDRLAAVQRLDDRQLARALLDQPRDPEDVLAALQPGQRRPGRLRGPCRGDRARDVVGARLGDLGQRLLGRRVDRRRVGPTGRLDELATDEQPVAITQANVVGGLRCRRVLPAQRRTRRRRGRRRPTVGRGRLRRGRRLAHAITPSRSPPPARSGRSPSLVLQQQVVEHRRGADAQQVGRQPPSPKRLLDQDEHAQRGLGVETPPAGFMPTTRPVRCA